MNLIKLIAVVMLVTLTFSAGLMVDRDHLIAALKNASLLLRALIANFIIVPALGVLLVRVFQVRADIATGMMLMAIAPGVPFILMGTRKKGGSLGFAVALAFLMPLLSIITIPLTAPLVLPAQAAADLPMTQFLKTLVLFQLIPLLLGLVLATRVPAFAARLVRPALIVFIIALVAVLVVLAPRIAESVANVYGSRGGVAMICLVLLSLVTGWLLGGPKREYRRTLALGTALRNIGLSFLLATVAFPNSGVGAAVMTYLLAQIVITGILGAFFARTAQAPAATG